MTTSEPTIFGLSPEFYFQNNVENRLKTIEKKLEEIFQELAQKLSDEKDKWELHISKGANCYLLTGKPEDYDHTITWSIEEDERDELKADKRLLYEIMDYFAIIGLKIMKGKTK